MFINKRRRLFFYKLFFVAFDALALCASIYLAVLVRFGPPDSIYYIQEKLLPLIMSVFLFIGIFYINGLYDPTQTRGYSKDMARISASVLLSIVLGAVIFYATFSFAIGRGIFILMILFIWFFTSLPRMTYLFIVEKKFLSKKTIIVGDDSSVSDTIDLIERHPYSLYEIEGIVTSEKTLARDAIKGYKILGTIDDIHEIVKHRKIDTVMVSSLDPRRSRIFKDLRVCMYQGMEMLDFVSVYEDLENQVPIKYIDDEWLFASIMNYPNFHVKKIKRLVDIIGSVALIIILFPVGLLSALLVKLDSNGPVFYTQKRLGRYGRSFRLIKFRSMVRHAERESNGPVWSQEDDNRITRVGRWLRRTRLDEVPQLINILRGDMSLVGPRPERPAFVKELSEKIPFYPERLYVQPGLTGWAQINFPYTSTIEESKIKLQYDVYYIKNVSFFLDLFILLKTLKTVLLSKGR